MLTRVLQVLAVRQREEAAGEEAYREWHDVACVLDRVLFYVFLIITIVSSVAILEMRPDNVHF